MKTILKRMVSLLLTVSFILGLVPMTVLADEETQEIELQFGIVTDAGIKNAKDYLEVDENQYNLLEISYDEVTVGSVIAYTLEDNIITTIWNELRTVDVNDEYVVSNVEGELVHFKNSEIFDMELNEIVDEFNESEFVLVDASIENEEKLVFDGAESLGKGIENADFEKNDRVIFMEESVYIVRSTDFNDDTQIINGVIVVEQEATAINWYVQTGDAWQENGKSGQKTYISLTDTNNSEIVYETFSNDNAPVVDDNVTHALTTSMLDGEVPASAILGLVIAGYVNNDEQLVITVPDGEGYVKTDSVGDIPEYKVFNLSGNDIFDARTNSFSNSIKVTENTKVIKITPVVINKQVTQLITKTYIGADELNGINNAKVVVLTEIEDGIVTGTKNRASYVFIAGKPIELQYGIVKNSGIMNGKDFLTIDGNRYYLSGISRDEITLGSIIAYTLEDDTITLWNELKTTDLNDNEVVTDVDNELIYINGNILDTEVDKNVEEYGETEFVLVDTSIDSDDRVVFDEVENLGRGLENVNFKKYDRLQRANANGQDIVYIIRSFEFDEDTQIVAGVVGGEVPVTHTVTFNAGTRASFNNTIVNDGEAVNMPYEGEYKVDGWNIAGWFTEPELENVYTFGDPVTADLNLYAKWNGTAVIYTYDLTNDVEKTNTCGTVSMTGYSGQYYNNALGSCVENEEYTATANPAEGYKFKEWRIGSKNAASAGTESTYTFKLTDSSSITIYAIFEKDIPAPTTYTLTILTNDPSCKVEYNQVKYDSNTVLNFEKGTQIMLFARAGSGMEFVNATSEEVEVVQNGSIGRIITMPESNVTVTFNFKTIHTHTPGEAVKENEVPATCTATGSYDEVVYCTECNEEISRETKTISAIGHAWGEWTETTAPTCTGKGENIRTCANDSSHVETQDIDPLGHDLTHVDSVDATTESAGNIEYWHCSRCDKYFSDAGTTEITNEATIIPQLSATTYTVTFNSNGGSAVEAQTINEGEKATKPDDPTNGELKFIGWFVNPTIENIYKEDSEAQYGYGYNTFDFTTPITENIELKALWVTGVIVNTDGEGTFSIQGPNIDESFTNVSTPVIIGLTNSIKLIAQAGEHYQFVKWTKDGEDYSENEEIDVTVTEETTFVAVFEPIECTISFDSNGGSGEMSSDTTFAGLTYILPACSFEAPEGKVFDKWNLGKKGAKITVTEDVTLVAQWKDKPTITPGGGGGSSTTTYKITTKIENGNIIPDNPKVDKNENQEFTFKANEGYEITDVLVDGKSVGKVESYKFEKVTAKHTIEVKTSKIKESIPTEQKPADKFTDVNSDDWYYDAINYVVKNGLFNGMTDTTFGPRNNLTRGMLVTVLYRYAKANETEKSTFDDVNKGAYYSKAIAWAAKNGIVNGIGNNKFNPDANVTRQELAAIIYRYMKMQGKGFTGLWSFLLDFADREEISDYAYEPVCYLTMNKIINGKNEKTFDPKGLATRAETAVIMQRVAEFMK